MTIVGQVKALWRYPVKSMQGESLSAADFTKGGVVGDRHWAVRDEQSGEIRGAKKFPMLMQCKARYRGEVTAANLPDVEITLPDGRILDTTDQDINETLSELLQKPVTIHALRPASDLDHYRRTVPLDESELRDVLAREPDEELPDLSVVPQDVLAEIVEYTSPRGTYFDAYPIHLLTTSWLAALAQKNPQSKFDVRRFRPNILIDGADAGLAEQAWCGKHLKIGDTVFECQIPTIRCGMTTRATGTLPEDRQVLRTIVRESDNNVGCYANVGSGGTIRVGDDVELFD